MRLPLPAAAQVVTTLERSGPDPGRLDIVDGGNGSIGLRVRLAPGWKFYWRTPGEGGVPPQFDWTGSQNLKAAQMVWPAPHRINIGHADLYGSIAAVLRSANRRQGKRGVSMVNVRWGRYP